MWSYAKELIKTGKVKTEKGKNQNILRDSDITRIVNAYHARQSEDKYSYVVSFDEIKENDFNLNISQYVDTFEEEELVDIEGGGDSGTLPTLRQS